MDTARLADDVDRVLGGPGEDRQLEDLVAQLVLVGMCATLGCARSTPSGSTGSWRRLTCARPRRISPRAILKGSRRRIDSSCSRSGRPGTPARLPVVDGAAVSPRCAGVEASVRCGGLAGGEVGVPGGCRHVEALGYLDAGDPRRVGAGERGRRAGRGLRHRGSSAGMARPARCGLTRSLRMRGVPNIRELRCHPTAPVPGRG